MIHKKSWFSNTIWLHPVLTYWTLAIPHVIRRSSMSNAHRFRGQGSHHILHWHVWIYSYCCNLYYFFVTSLFPYVIVTLVRLANLIQRGFLYPPVQIMAPTIFILIVSYVRAAIIDSADNAVHQRRVLREGRASLADIESGFGSGTVFCEECRLKV